MVQGGQGLCTKKSQHIWAGEDKWVGSGPEWASCLWEEGAER